MKPKTRFTCILLVLALSAGLASAITSTGFAKIKPQLSSMQLFDNGTFNSIFTNGVGQTIQVREVRVWDLFANRSSCSASIHQIVSAGDNFQVNLDGCNFQTRYSGTAISGELFVYDVRIEIDYDTSVGVTNSFTESGTYRGVVLVEKSIGYMLIHHPIDTLYKIFSYFFPYIISVFFLYGFYLTYMGRLSKVTAILLIFIALIILVLWQLGFFNTGSV
jgi:hypothetical protein